MSYMCAILIQSLEDIPQAASIHAFCGGLTTGPDQCDKVGGLLRSLISQLVSLYDFDLSLLEKRTFRSRVRDHKLKSLCELFSILIKQVPRDTPVFCVIDGISFLESQGSEDACYCIRELQRLAEDDEVDAIFKLLVTSQFASRYVCDYFSTDNCLTAPRTRGRRCGPMTRRTFLGLKNRSRMALLNSQGGVTVYDDDE